MCLKMMQRTCNCLWHVLGERWLNHGRHRWRVLTAHHRYEKHNMMNAVYYVTWHIGCADLEFTLPPTTCGMAKPCSERVCEAEAILSATSQSFAEAARLMCTCPAVANAIPTCLRPVDATGVQQMPSEAATSQPMAHYALQHTCQLPCCHSSFPHSHCYPVQS